MVHRPCSFTGHFTGVVAVGFSVSKSIKKNIPTQWTSYTGSVQRLRLYKTVIGQALTSSPHSCSYAFDVRDPLSDSVRLTSRYTISSRGELWHFARLHVD